jgi:hypothetical protein
MSVVDGGLNNRVIQCLLKEIKQCPCSCIEYLYRSSQSALKLFGPTVRDLSTKWNYRVLAFGSTICILFCTPNLW